MNDNFMMKILLDETTLRRAGDLEDAMSTAQRRFDPRDIDLGHLHHRIERALGRGAIGTGLIAGGYLE